MGNLFAESSLHFNNVQNICEARVGGDSYYTQAVDGDSYSRDSFSNDGVGYGIAQWTTSDRKTTLYDLCKSRGKSIADPQCQIDHLYNELKQYNLIIRMNTASSVQEASNIFLLEFEKPKNKGLTV
jgi:hypothetical protein